MAYFLPAILNSTGIIEAGEGSNHITGQPLSAAASLLMFCLSIDIKGILNLGPKALIMFFAATHAGHRRGGTGGPVAGQPNPTRRSRRRRPRCPVARPLHDCRQLDRRRSQPDCPQGDCTGSRRPIQRHDHRRRVRGQPLDAIPFDRCRRQCRHRQAGSRQTLLRSTPSNRRWRTISKASRASPHSTTSWCSSG